MSATTKTPKVTQGMLCPNPGCGCRSWVRTTAGRLICGYCAYPDYVGPVK